MWVKVSQEDSRTHGPGMSGHVNIKLLNFDIYFYLFFLIMPLAYKTDVPNFIELIELRKRVTSLESKVDIQDTKLTELSQTIQTIKHAGMV